MFSRVLLRLVDCVIKVLLRVQDDVCFQNQESFEWKCLSSRFLILHKSVQESVGFHFTFCLHTFLLTISYTLPIQVLTCAWTRPEWCLNKLCTTLTERECINLKFLFALQNFMLKLYKSLRIFSGWINVWNKHATSLQEIYLIFWRNLKQ